MLSDTLTDELGRYAIGPRIKALRLRKKLGLVQLAAHTGLSSAMLSKIERGQMFPTLPTLLRVAMVFGVGLDHFFSPEKEKPLIAVVRKEQRLKLPAPPGGQPPSWLFESLDYPVADRRMEAFYAEFPPRRTAIGTAPSWQRGVHLRVERGPVVDVDGSGKGSSMPATLCTSIQACRTATAAMARMSARP